MRLKKIRLAGFKSFVDPTNIPFPGDMTAVVGPNGCGKSNVIDAVRWVLGESSAKNLRGDSMTDVIFNGSSARKPVSQCSVELVFDNSSGRIQGEFAAFNEISVKRLVTKDAVSSYFLNSAKCRRRDITDLFLGTGLGPRSYAIIEQGMISKLIESKPQDLRVFIEEAAGISKYKERRKETQTRIAHTKENLDRLEDVRQELGDQIAKLKRQAIAATRYKELKQEERTLKAELATIKWLAQSKQQANLQQQIDEKNIELESLSSSQQGDESGLHALKNDQLMVKQQIDDIQQTVFNTGTEITKLEQSQLFAQKRLTQIQSEVAQLKQAESALTINVEQLNRELEQTKVKLLDAEPQKELLEEQVFELENIKHEVDEKLQAFLRESKSDDDIYHSKKQVLQQKHGQIQQSLAIQQRLNTRIVELNQELSEQNIADIELSLAQTESSLEDAMLQAELAQTNWQQLSDDQARHRSQLSEQRKLVSSQEAQKLGITTKKQTLEDMQVLPTGINGVLENLQLNSAKACWEYFSVKPGYEKALDAAFQEIQEGSVLNTSLTVNLLTKLPHNSPPILFDENFIRKKTEGSLASVILNDAVPEFTNHIFVCDTVVDALDKINEGGNVQKVVTKDGTILTPSSIIFAKQSDTKVLRKAQIDQLSQTLQQLTPELEEANLKLAALVEQEASLASAQIAQSNILQEAKVQVQKYELEHKNLVFQQSQFAKRNDRLLQDISKQEIELEQEAMQLETVTEQVEELSEELALLEDNRSQNQHESDNLQQQQQNTQIQFNQLQAKLHQHALLYQQLQNSITVLQEQTASKQTSLVANQEKLAMLQEEAEDLNMPSHEQEQKLQSLLLEQEQHRAKLETARMSLEKIESDIADLEKGQHGIVAKMDKIKAEIASLRIQSETAKVRAQSHIEQLAELSQSVIDIIATLDEQAEEKLWQSKLDKVVQSLSRLGAVNLAAVEEYEQQFERKKHLDDQNDDLTQALDTLETAMRKIDKETRTRFKYTFDQVNGDLKMLFPKVFGGGAAYLDLTGDDLLETGVTIMARPPGKKNSTIHLLSGGEKALTALSLVFAIFRLNPAPFCLLDEVDAPLDDANVGRFCRLVSEMSKSVQFIYITHNKVAMEMATHLTGVTMAEPGVSRMVAVDMEQALAIAE